MTGGTPGYPCRSLYTAFHCKSHLVRRRKQGDFEAARIRQNHLAASQEPCNTCKCSFNIACQCQGLAGLSLDTMSAAGSHNMKQAVAAKA